MKDETEHTNSPQGSASFLKRLVMCFLVSDYVKYEGCSAIAVFKNRKQAEAFVQRCTEHDKREPKCPDGDSTEEWSKYDADWEMWADSHPGGESCTTVDSYVVSEIPYYT